MSIKYRLYGGFGILVVMTLGLVIYGVQQFNDISVSVTRMNGISENSTRTLLIARYLETMRRSVLRYAYDHDEPDAFSGQDYFPEALGRRTFYDPPERGFEREIKKRLEYWAKLRKERKP